MSEQPIPLHPSRLHTLDTLRGIAILLILMFHATDTFIKLDQTFLLNIFRFADAGVEFFFVLSGFTLVWVHARDLGQRGGRPGLTWQSFLLKRCLRIYPFYWLVTLAIIPLYLVIPAFGENSKRNIGVILKSLLLIPQQQESILAVAWFLSYILLFYGLFSLLIALKPKISLSIWGSWLALSVAFNIVSYTTGWGQGDGYFWLRFFLSLYGIEFAAGGLMAYWLIYHRPKRTWRTACLGYGILAFIVFGLIDDYPLKGFNSPMMQGYEFITYGVASVFLIGGMAASECEAKRPGGKPSRAVEWLQRSPHWLGAASYAIFLTHFPILLLGIKLLSKLKLGALQANIGGIFCCLLACLAGWLSYRYVERPVNKLVRSGVQQWQEGSRPGRL